MNYVETFFKIDKIRQVLKGEVSLLISLFLCGIEV